MNQLERLQERRRKNAGPAALPKKMKLRTKPNENVVIADFTDEHGEFWRQKTKAIQTQIKPTKPNFKANSGRKTARGSMGPKKKRKKLQATKLHQPENFSTKLQNSVAD